MLNPQRNASASKRKFEVGIATLTLFLCVIGLLGMSVMSFFQTQSAFIPLNDPTMVFQDIQFGSWIAFLAALIFQYGQNAALYVKNTYATGKVFINLFGLWEIKDTTICWIVFWTCAAIDAGTNCLWLYNQQDIRKQPIVFQVIEYFAMVAIVAVEEVLGIVLQALAHSFTLFKQIIASERKTPRTVKEETLSTQPRQTTQTPPKSTYQPQNKPNSNNDRSNNPSYQRPQQSQTPQGKYEPKNKPTGNNQPPKQSSNPNNDFFNKPVQKPQDNNNGQSGRYLQMMEQKKNGGYPVHPYENSGDDQPDWND